MLAKVNKIAAGESCFFLAGKKKPGSLNEFNAMPLIFTSSPSCYSDALVLCSIDPTGSSVFLCRPHPRSFASHIHLHSEMSSNRTASASSGSSAAASFSSSSSNHADAMVDVPAAAESSSSAAASSSSAGRSNSPKRQRTAKTTSAAALPAADTHRAPAGPHGSTAAAAAQPRPGRNSASASAGSPLVAFSTAAASSSSGSGVRASPLPQVPDCASLTQLLEFVVAGNKRFKEWVAHYFPQADDAASHDKTAAADSSASASATSTDPDAPRSGESDLQAALLLRDRQAADASSQDAAEWLEYAQQRGIRLMVFGGKRAGKSTLLSALVGNGQRLLPERPTAESFTMVPVQISLRAMARQAARQLAATVTTSMAAAGKRGCAVASVA